MKYLIVPAQDIQAGDIIFTNKGDGAGIQFCGRVLGLNAPRPHPDISEYRVEVVAGDNDEGTHTTIGFRHETKVGVVRDDAYVDVDISSILQGMDD